MDTVGPALESLRDHASQWLEDCGRPACLVSLTPGNTVSWDHCCDCGDGEGQMWVRLVSAVPQPAGVPINRVTDLQVRAAVGVVRCMHGLRDDGSAPTAAEMNGDTIDTTLDADTLLDSLLTWGGTQFAFANTVKIEQGLTLGPTGYCGGFEWTFTFRVALCIGC